METLLKRAWRMLGPVAAACLAGIALAGEPSVEPAPESPPADAPTNPESTPSAAEAPPPSVSVPPVVAGEEAAEDAPGARPPKPPPAYRGAEMREAFKGGGSRHGVSGRVNKLPAKKTARKKKDDWRLKIEAGIGTASGDRDMLRCNAAASASRETDLRYVLAKATVRYGESEGEKDAENGAFEAKYQRRLTERTYAAVDGNAFRDRIADVDYRVRGSVSLGRHFIFTERTVLNLEAGPGYVEERKGGESEGFVAGRAAQYLEFLVSSSLQVWQSVEYVPSLEDSRIYFVNAEVGIETALAANLGLRFVVESRFDSNPAAGKEKHNLLTTTALSWSF